MDCGQGEDAAINLKARLGLADQLPEWLARLVACHLGLSVGLPYSVTTGFP